MLLFNPMSHEGTFKAGLLHIHWYFLYKREVPLDGGTNIDRIKNDLSIYKRGPQPPHS